MNSLSWYRNNAKYHPLAASLPPLFNCWSLVVDMRATIFGLPFLPLHGGIHADDKRELSMAASSTIDSYLVESKIKIGAIAAAYRASLCVHVGLVIEIDGKPHIAEIGSKTGFRILSIERFEAAYTKVRYYIDK